MTEAAAPEIMFPRVFPRRGEIYSVDFGEPRGAPQAFERPGLVVSSDTNNEHAPTVIVAALTKRIWDRSSAVRVVVPAGMLPLDSTILCNQLLTLDKSDLIRFRGELGVAKMREVDAALAKALALSMG